MTRVRLHPLADAELLLATDWYLARSPTAAARFVREMERAMQRIAEAPNRYRRATSTSSAESNIAAGEITGSFNGMRVP